jgi:hypothetical protein
LSTPPAGLASSSKMRDNSQFSRQRELPQGGICVLSRQRIVGNANGSSAYLLSLCQALHRDGHALHLLCPSPSVFGRWPVLVMGRDMAIFRSIKIRGALRIGRTYVAVDPTVLRRALVGVLGKALERLGIRVAALSKKAPYSIGLPWDSADLHYVERHAPQRADGVLVD